MRESVKKDPVIKEKFKEYGVSISEIDDIPVCFCDLDVSAKTKDKKIYLNIGMLFDRNINPTHYLIHELIHFLQQKTGLNKNESDTEDYLDKESEKEAFQAQVDYKKRDEGEHGAEEYVDGLLDHHGLSGKKRKNKKKELMDE